VLRCGFLSPQAAETVDLVFFILFSYPPYCVSAFLPSKRLISSDDRLNASFRPPPPPLLPLLARRSTLCWKMSALFSPLPYRQLACAVAAVRLLSRRQVHDIPAELLVFFSFFHF